MSIAWPDSLSPSPPLWMGLHSNRLHRRQDLALGTSAEPTQPLPVSPPLQLDGSAAPAPPNTPSLEDPSARGPMHVTCPPSMCWGELEPEETGCQQEQLPVQPVTQDSVPYLHPHSMAENGYKWPEAQGGFPAHAPMPPSVTIICFPPTWIWPISSSYV